jgi:hypothetical protein
MFTLDYELRLDQRKFIPRRHAGWLSLVKSRIKEPGFLHQKRAVILSEAKNGASGASDIDCKAAQVAASESGDERVQSRLLFTAALE